MSVFAASLGNQETYASVRDCMRSVTDVERGAQSQGSTITPEEGRLLAQARDLCMQTRYDGVREALEAVAGPSDSQPAETHRWLRDRRTAGRRGADCRRYRVGIGLSGGAGPGSGGNGCGGSGGSGAGPGSGDGEGLGG